jgi:hypothetical protein
MNTTPIRMIELFGFEFPWIVWIAIFAIIYWIIKEIYSFKDK